MDLNGETDRERDTVLTEKNSLRQIAAAHVIAGLQDATP